MRTGPFVPWTRNVAAGTVLALAVFCLSAGAPAGEMHCPSVEGMASFCAQSGAVDPGPGPAAVLPVLAVTPHRPAPRGLVWSAPDPPWGWFHGGARTPRAPPFVLA